MSKKDVCRNKMVCHRGVRIESDSDGVVTISVAGGDSYAAKQLILTETEYIALYDNAAIMINWHED